MIEKDKKQICSCGRKALVYSRYCLVCYKHQREFDEINNQFMNDCDKILY